MLPIPQRVDRYRHDRQTAGHVFVRFQRQRALDPRILLERDQAYKRLLRHSGDGIDRQAPEMCYIWLLREDPPFRRRVVIGAAEPELPIGKPPRQPKQQVVVQSPIDAALE